MIFVGETLKEVLEKYVGIYQTEEPNITMGVVSGAYLSRVLVKFKEEKIELLSPDHVYMRENIKGGATLALQTRSSPRG